MSSSVRFAALGFVPLCLAVVVACNGPGGAPPSEASPPVDEQTPAIADRGGDTTGPSGRRDIGSPASPTNAGDRDTTIVEDTADGDAGPAADAGSAADAASSCATTEPFSPSIEVPGLEHAVAQQPGESVPQLSDVRLTADELRAVYTRSSKYLPPELVEVTRPSRAVAFAGARTMPELAHYSKSHGTLSPDGLVIYFDGNHPDKGVFSAQRTDASLPFDAPVAVMPLTDKDYAPYVVGTDLWFERMGVSDFHIFSVSLVAGGAIPVAATGLDAALGKSDVDPVVSADGLTVFFARGASPSNPGALGTANAGSPRIMEARRASLQAPFVIREVCELNSTGSERPSWLSPDGCRLYFTSGNTVRVASRCAP